MKKLTQKEKALLKFKQPKVAIKEPDTDTQTELGEINHNINK